MENKFHSILFINMFQMIPSLCNLLNWYVSHSYFKSFLVLPITGGFLCDMLVMINLSIGLNWLIQIILHYFYHYYDCISQRHYLKHDSESNMMQESIDQLWTWNITSWTSVNFWSVHHGNHQQHQQWLCWGRYPKVTKQC